MFLIFTAKRQLLVDSAGTATWSEPHGVRLEVLGNADILEKARPYMRNRLDPSFLLGARHQLQIDLSTEIAAALHVELGGYWLVSLNMPVSIHEQEDDLSKEHEEMARGFTRMLIEKALMHGPSFIAALVKMNVTMGPRDAQHLEEVSAAMGGRDLTLLEMFEHGVDVEAKDASFDVERLAYGTDSDQLRRTRDLMRLGYVPLALKAFFEEEDVPVAKEALRKLAERLVFGRPVEIGKYRRQALLSGAAHQQIESLLQAGDGARLLTPEEFLRIVTGWGSKRGIYVAPPMKKSRWARLITEGMP